MKNKYIIIILAILAILAVVIDIIVHENNKSNNNEESNKNVEITTETYLFDLDTYKDLKLDDINKMTTVRYTVAGDDRKETYDKNEIETMYNMLKNIKIKEKTNMACEDNTTVYIFETSEEKQYKVEFECNWLVFGRERFTYE